MRLSIILPGFPLKGSRVVQTVYKYTLMSVIVKETILSPYFSFRGKPYISICVHAS